MQRFLRLPTALRLVDTGQEQPLEACGAGAQTAVYSKKLSKFL